MVRTLPLLEWRDMGGTTKVEHAIVKSSFSTDCAETVCTNGPSVIAPLDGKQRSRKPRCGHCCRTMQNYRVRLLEIIRQAI